MTNAGGGEPFRGIRTLFESGTLAGLPDAQLLERFASSRAEAEPRPPMRPRQPFRPWSPGMGRWCWASAAAFSLALRTSKMPFRRRSSCSFAVPARSGSTTSLGRWIHGVARRGASKARVRSERRRARLPASSDDPDVPGFDPERAELLAALDEELGRLPGKYQAPVILCHLEGLTPCGRGARGGFAGRSGRLAGGFRRPGDSCNNA